MVSKSNDELFFDDLSSMASHKTSIPSKIPLPHRKEFPVSSNISLRHLIHKPESTESFIQKETLCEQLLPVHDILKLTQKQKKIKGYLQPLKNKEKVRLPPIHLSPTLKSLDEDEELIRRSLARIDLLLSKKPMFC
jgi:hypothetical protein